RRRADPRGGLAGAHRGRAAAGWRPAGRYGACDRREPLGPPGVIRVFTGIVEELGRVVARDGARLRIGARAVLDGVRLGDSTAVNGCCLTVVAFEEPGPEG